MRMVRAKVLATGEEKLLVEKEDDPGVFFVGFSNEKYKADELEILADSTTMGWPASGGMPQMPDTIAMMKEVLDSVRSHFWRDQRVEIAKILLRREDLKVTDVAMTADEIVRKLKSYGE